MSRTGVIIVIDLTVVKQIHGGYILYNYSMSKKYWFKRKRYGYGWVPANRAGWMLIGIYILTVLLSSTILIDAPEDQISPQVVIYVAIFVISTVTTVTVTCLTGPKPKWRWGKKPGDDPSKDF